MPRSQIYVIPAPIGDQFADFSVAALRTIEAQTHLLLESDDHFVRRLRERKVLKDSHQIEYFDDPPVAIAAAKRLIERGDDFVIMASSGVPGFVDPGWQICHWVLENAIDSTDLHPVGMSSALDAALALAGVNLQWFTMAGHYPEQYKTKDLERNHDFPVVYYVRGPYIDDFVDEMYAHFKPFARLVVFRDLRKKGKQRIYLLKEDGKNRPEFDQEISTDYVAVLVPYGIDLDY